MHVSKPTEYTPPRVNPNVNRRLWVITTCPRRFTDGNNSTTRADDVDNGGSYVCVGQWVHKIYLCLPLSFPINLKLPWKNKIQKHTNKFVTPSNVIQLRLTSSNGLAGFQMWWLGTGYNQLYWVWLLRSISLPPHLLLGLPASHLSHTHTPAWPGMSTLRS